MKKIYTTLAIALISTVGLAQTKITTTGGTPNVNPDAALEIEAEDKGLLLPRVELTSLGSPLPLTDHVEGMTVYNTNTVAEENIFPGFYYNDGSKWGKMSTADDRAVKFFYMPSIVFDTSVSDTGVTKNLYEEYKKQFSLQSGNAVLSDGAPNAIPYFANAQELYYYVTDFDPAVFSNISIDVNGVMTYDVTDAATDSTIINVVFVVKQ